MEYWKEYWKSHWRFESANPHVKVGRTVFGEPVSDKDWEKTVTFLTKKTLITKEKTVLDLCCGNGLLSIPFAEKAKNVTSVDFSSILINELKSLKIKNINAYSGDVNKLDFRGKHFDVILIYFAIQHFNQTEAIALIRKAKSWLKPGGCLYIGDIPDESKLWHYFHLKKFRHRYYEALEKSEPIIGNWFTTNFFKYLGEYLNYKKVEIVKQPRFMINHFYRFDVFMSK